MKIAGFIVIFSLCGAILAADDLTVDEQKPYLRNGNQRPEFKDATKALFREMAEDNGYDVFDKCHVIPWSFIKRQVQDNFKSDKEYLETFINDLATIHAGATFIKKLSRATEKKLERLTGFFKAKASKALYQNEEDLKQALFNMPSNVYPGNRPVNHEIGNNFDAPRSGTAKKRSEQATDHAKELWEKYHDKGLTALINEDERTRGTWAMTSDKPPAVKKLYVKID